MRFLVLLIMSTILSNCADSFNNLHDYQPSPCACERQEVINHANV